MLTGRTRGDQRKLAPRWLELWALVILAGLYLSADAFWGQSSHPTMNVLGPLTLSAILAHGAWILVRGDSKHLWTALLWFRLSTTVFFGVGTFIIFVLDTEGRQYVEAFFWFFDEDVFKMNLVVTTAVTLVLGFARVAVLVADRAGYLQPTTTNQADREQSLVFVAGVFLVIGLIFDYTVKVPYDFGWINVEIPGFIMNLTRLKLVGFLLLTVWALQDGRWWLPVITAVVIVDLALQALLFSKGDFLITLLVFLLAFVWDKASAARLFACGALVAFAFAALQPVITEGRRQLEQRYGDQPQAGFVERAGIIHAYFTDEKLPDGIHGGASALTRLSYVNAATLVITRFDAGQPGDWPKLLPAVFVPRLLWSDKPVISDVGRDIYELATGRRTSQSGAGVFADAYWAMGWWGIVTFMPVYGLILGVFTVMSVRVVEDGRWLYFPGVLLTIRIGFRTDGHYLVDVAGATVIVVGTLGVLWAISNLVTRLTKRAVVPQRALMR